MHMNIGRNLTFLVYCFMTSLAYCDIIYVNVCFKPSLCFPECVFYYKVYIVQFYKENCGDLYFHYFFGLTLLLHHAGIFK